MKASNASSVQPRATRRRWFARLAVVILALILLCVYIRATEGMSGLSQELASKLDRERVASFELNDATEEQAVERLNQLFKQSNQFKDIHVEIWKGAAPPKGFHRRLKPHEEGSSAIPKITLKLPANVDPRMPRIPGLPEANSESDTDVSLHELLGYISKLSDASVGQKGNTLYFIPGEGEFGPLVEHTFWVPGVFDSTGGMPPQTPEHVLADNGIRFFEGAKAELISPDRLRVRCFQEDMFLCECILGDPEPTWMESVESWCLDKWEKVKTFIGFP